jgi:hypothetical protein
MAKGGARAVSGPAKGTKYPRAKKLVATAADIRRAARQSKVSPLDYMLAVLNDEQADPVRRDRMAVSAAPFVHAKAGDLGKKAQAEVDAETAGEGTEWGDDLTPRAGLN